MGQDQCHRKTLHLSEGEYGAGSAGSCHRKTLHLSEGEYGAGSHPVL